MSSNMSKSNLWFFSTPRSASEHDPIRVLYLNYEGPFIPQYQIGWNHKETPAISTKDGGWSVKKTLSWFYSEYFVRPAGRVCETIGYDDLHVTCEFRLARLSFTGPEEVRRTYAFVDEHRGVILVDVGKMDPEEFIRAYTSRFPLLEIENSTRKEMPGFTPEMFVGALEKESQKKFVAPRAEGKTRTDHLEEKYGKDFINYCNRDLEEP